MRCPRCGAVPEEEAWERDLEVMSVYFKCSNGDCPVQGFTTFFEEEDVLLLALKEMAK